MMGANALRLYRSPKITARAADEMRMFGKPRQCCRWCTIWCGS